MTKVSIVVPNHGRDISAIEKVVKDTPEVELLEVDLGMERSAQRNIGICSAKGKYIFVLDSDQVPTQELIYECIAIMERNPGCNGIYIPEIIRGDDWFTRLRSFERQFYTSTPIDVVRFVRASICPLFDESMTGPEDADWDLRIPPVKLQSHNVLYHDDRVSFFNYIRKKSYYTRSMRKFLELHPDAKVLKWWYRIFGVFMENGKWKQLVKHPIMAVKLYILIFIRAIIYLQK
jgi:glycosyltransferase involved in cell wall biosynthesis